MFVPIKINDLDSNLSHRVRGEIYALHFSLSAWPEALWCDIFRAIWDNQWYSMKRRAHVQGRYLVVECPMDEYEPHHKERITRAVEETNHRYLQALQEREREAALQRAERDREKATLEEFAEKLKKGQAEQL